MQKDIIISDFSDETSSRVSEPQKTQYIQTPFLSVQSNEFKMERDLFISVQLVKPTSLWIHR